MKNRVFQIVLATLLLIATGVVAYGCQPAPVEKPIPPDPFTTTWYLSEEQGTVTFSGDSAGHVAGEISEFKLKLDNDSSEPWQGKYVVQLLDRIGIVMEIARETFYVPSSVEQEIVVQVEFNGELYGPYGLSLYFPTHETQSIETIWIGEETPVSAGPWPSIATRPWLWPESTEFSEETTQQLAEDFVRHSPTFAFDGIAESLELTATAAFSEKHISIDTPAEDEVRGCEFTFQFESRHAGYGDRTGQMLSQVITPHEAVITVEQGKVISAIVDGKWDILRQSMLD